MLMFCFVLNLEIVRGSCLVSVRIVRFELNLTFWVCSSWLLGGFPEVDLEFFRIVVDGD